MIKHIAEEIRQYGVSYGVMIITPLLVALIFGIRRESFLFEYVFYLIGPLGLPTFPAIDGMSGFSWVLWGFLIVGFRFSIHWLFIRIANRLGKEVIVALTFIGQFLLSFIGYVMLNSV